VISRLSKQVPDVFFSHQRVLDIGAGAGTYSDRYRNVLPKLVWEGVEIWEPYIEKFNLRSKYDVVHTMDARKIEELRTFMIKKYDIAFVGDVLEHMTKEEAIDLLLKLQMMCHTIIVSIPIIHYPQGEYEGNPYEAHVKDDWSHEEVVASFPGLVTFGVENEIGCYVYAGKSTQSRMLEEILKPKIGVYGICKNEERFVDRFYDSLHEADHVVIIDTGSTDKTFDRFCELAEERMHLNGNDDDWEVEVYSNGAEAYVRSVSDGTMQVRRATIDPWRFDDARNVALALLPEDLDVVISLDLDEVLPSNWRRILDQQLIVELQTTGRLSDRYNHRFRTIWNWDTTDPPHVSEHWHERIHARKGFMWKLPVHEHLVKVDGSAEKMAWISDLWMVQMPDNSKPRSSYLPMLEQSLRENPTRWKSWSFYSGDLLNAGRYDEAIVALNKALALEDSDKPFIYYQLSRCYQQKGDNANAMVQMLLAIASAPHVREYYVWTARMFMSLNKPKQAISYLMQAAEITDKPSGYVYDYTCWDNYFDLYFAEVAQAAK
jgi:tetratricopeptide (TPR) repeat protein